MKDPRVNKTKQHIENTFFELLQEKEIGHISVKELCSHAEISRSTFYDHFVDFPHFIESLENKVVDKYVECMKLYDYDTDSENFIDALFQAIKMNRNLFSFMFNEKLNGKTKEKFIQSIKEIALPIWAKESDLCIDELEIIYAYMMNGSVAILSDWYHGKIDIEEAKLKELYSNVIKYGVYNYVYTV